MSDDLLRITHALLRSDTTLAAVRELHGCTERTAVEGLVELVYRHRTAGEAVAAIDALAASSNPIVCDALEASLESVHSSVRLAAVLGLQRYRPARNAELIVRVLGQDESWPVRRAALQFLAQQQDPEHWRVLIAATDPHWRVRHALISTLLRWGEDLAQREEIDKRMTQVCANTYARGVHAYLQFRWSGRVVEGTKPSVATPPLWDWDAAVLLRNLEYLNEQGRREALDQMAFLLRHADERIRALAGKSLRDWGQVEHLLPVVAILDEPRQDGFSNAVKLLNELDDDRKEALALLLLRQAESTGGTLAWALDQIGEALPADDVYSDLTRLMENASAQSVGIRCSLVRLHSRWNHPAIEECFKTLVADSDTEVKYQCLRSVNRRQRPHIDQTLLQELLDCDDARVRAEAVTAAVRLGWHDDVLKPMLADPEAPVRVRLAQEMVARGSSSSEMIERLQADAHPLVRAAALTPKHAAELTDDPSRESSWHVLASAARLARIPIWKLAPETPWRPSAPLRTSAEPLKLGPAEVRQGRALGAGQLAVAPLGISGHYGLPVQGFCRAYEAGVNLMFWEPNYGTMTDFYARVSPSLCRSIHLVAGTFEADGTRVRRDAERVLRSLKIDRIATFLLFWVRSWQRITPDVRAALEQLKTEGKIAAFGLSTHSRQLAVEALDAGWDPVMVRHSAAHRGVEKEVCPKAVQRGARLITFSNTCYGRLLQARGDLPPPTAADCYRYTLEQPGVRACLSAPASLSQLEENLEALRDPVLPDERRNYLLSVGEKLYAEETVFRKFVRDV